MWEFFRLSKKLFYTFEIIIIIIIIFIFEINS